MTTKRKPIIEKPTPKIKKKLADIKPDDLQIFASPSLGGAPLWGIRVNPGNSKRPNMLNLHTMMLGEIDEQTEVEIEGSLIPHTTTLLPLKEWRQPAPREQMTTILLAIEGHLLNLDNGHTTIDSFVDKMKPLLEQMRHLQGWLKPSWSGIKE